MKKLEITFMVAATILFFTSVIFIGRGFDYKNNYVNNREAPMMNINAYVAGDSYNYIINSNYFTGFMVLGCSFGMCSALFFCTGLYIHLKEQ